MLQMFQLQKVVPIERCRLVKYDEFYESLEHSYEGEEVTNISLFPCITCSLYSSSSERQKNILMLHRLVATNL